MKKEKILCTKIAYCHSLKKQLNIYKYVKFLISFYSILLYISDGLFFQNKLYEKKIQWVLYEKHLL